MATKKPAAKPAKNSKGSVSSAKKSAPAKKAVAKKAPIKKKTVINKKAAPANKAKAVSAKNSKKAAPPKKGAVVKKTIAVKKTVARVAPNHKKTVKKSTSKTVPAKKFAVPAKKAAPVAKKVIAPAKKVVAPAKKAVAQPATKKAAPAKAAPIVAKKAAPAKAAPIVAKKAAPAKAIPPAPVKKAVPAKPVPVVAKAAPAPKSPSRSGKKGSRPTKTIVQTKTLSSTPSRPAPSQAARTMREEKKPTVIIAHRKLEGKAKTIDEAAGKTMINYQPDYTRSILDQPVEQQSNGPIYRYSDEELQEFRELITRRLEAARKELVYLQGLITRKDEAGTEDTENRYMNMEDGSGAMEREQLAQLASRQIQFINHLEKAQMRIENKTYGICRVTGKLIDKARLRAVPHATLSIEAKKMMSK
ncbi:MAG: TraR/DksA C4-type zinc finger protein [Taibaiella sp.]|nr:TraR/DksA C4-type zinc finger protein [Taibaiella sp.]